MGPCLPGLAFYLPKFPFFFSSLDRVCNPHVSMIGVNFKELMRDWYQCLNEGPVLWIKIIIVRFDISFSYFLICAHVARFKFVIFLMKNDDFLIDFSNNRM